MRMAICLDWSGSSCFPFNLFGKLGLGDGWSGLTGERIFFWGGTSDGPDFSGLAFDLAEVFFSGSLGSLPLPSFGATFADGNPEKKTSRFVVSDTVKHLFCNHDCFGYQCQVSFSPTCPASLDSLDFLDAC